MNFWKKIKKPIMCSAPMSGITDIAFRHMLSEYAKPDVIFTEFVSCDGLVSEGKEKLLSQLQFEKREKPIVAQLFGSKPENFYFSAKLCQKLGFDGIDINMGCPDKDVIKQNAGASLILQPELARKIIKATKEGSRKLPISVKTRIGYSQPEVEKWIKFLLEQKPAVITLHGRTKQQKYKGEVNWKEIKKAKALIKKSSSQTLLIGNGDIQSLKEADEKAKRYDLDGIMIGRALLNDPLLFNEKKSIHDLSIRERKSLLIEHVEVFNKKLSQRNFSDLKKFYSTYLSNFKGAKELRIKLMKADSPKELKNILKTNKIEL